MLCRLLVWMQSVQCVKNESSLNIIESRYRFYSPWFRLTNKLRYDVRYNVPIDSRYKIWRDFFSVFNHAVLYFGWIRWTRLQRSAKENFVVLRIIAIHYALCRSYDTVHVAKTVHFLRRTTFVVLQRKRAISIRYTFAAQQRSNGSGCSSTCNLLKFDGTTTTTTASSTRSNS